MFRHSPRPAPHHPVRRPGRVFRCDGWRLAATTVLYGSALVAAGCGRGGQAAGSGPQGRPAVPVTVAVIAESQVEDATEYIGTLKALRSASVRPQVEGHITRIYVTSGDRVAPGARLLQIDPERQQAAVASQEASIEAREAEVEYSRQQLERMKGLFAQRVVSKAELDQAETAFRTAEAALAAARAQLREGRVELQYYEVLAPAGGMVGDVPVRVGDRVTRDTQLTTLDSNDQLEVLVPVPSERAADLKEGLRLELVGQDGKATADTTITFISPRVDAGSQAVLVKAIVRNPTGLLRSQQYVRVRVIWATRPRLTIPVLSVVRLGGQAFVFLLDEKEGQQVARQRPVRLGPIVGDAYAVVDGVSAGDRIITSGVQKLGDGAPVATNAGQG